MADHDDVPRSRAAERSTAGRCSSRRRSAGGALATAGLLSDRALSALVRGRRQRHVLLDQLDQVTESEAFRNILAEGLPRQR